MHAIDLISNTIRNRHRLSIQGKGDKGWRIVEPHVLYRAKNGQVVLSCFQTEGYTSSGHLPDWRSFKVAEIVGIEVLPEQFQPRSQEGYNPGSKRYAQVICAI